MDIEKIIFDIEKEIRYHKDEIDRIESELLVLRKYLPVKANKVSGSGNVIGHVPSLTFKQAILSFLSDGAPKRARDLYELYKGYKNDNEYKYRTFSPQLSIMKEVKKQEFINKTQDERYYYGKLDWFDGDRLKPQYLQKILDKNK